MADPMDFELRLGAAVKVFATNVDRPVDAALVAATALGAANEGWLSRQLRRPALARRSLATAAIALAFVVLAGFGDTLYASRMSIIGPGPSPTPSFTATPKPTRALPTEAAPPAVVPPKATATSSEIAGQTSGGMWPQSNLDEVRAAQEAADAGDPEYTWQVDPDLVSPPDGELGDYLLDQGTQIVERFVRDELGWDHAQRISGFRGRRTGGRCLARSRLSPLRSRRDKFAVPGHRGFCCSRRRQMCAHDR